MRLLLVNNNPAVSRLITLSADKMGLSLIEVKDFESFDGSEYDIALIDSELFDEEAVKIFKSMGLCSHLIYIGARGTEKPTSMDSMIEKPFLPTDFITMIEAIKKNFIPSKEIPKPEIFDDEMVNDDMDDLPEIEELKQHNHEPINLDDDESLEDVFGELDALSAFDEDTTDELGETQEDDSDDLDTMLDGLDMSDEAMLEDESLGEISLEAPSAQEDPTVILDSDDIKEVKDLLEDTSLDEDLDNEDESLSLSDDEEESLEDAFTLEDEEEVSGEQSVDDIMREIDAMGGMDDNEDTLDDPLAMLDEIGNEDEALVGDDLLSSADALLEEEALNMDDDLSDDMDDFVAKTFEKTVEKDPLALLDDIADEDEVFEEELISPESALLEEEALNMDDDLSDDMDDFVSKAFEETVEKDSLPVLDTAENEDEASFDDALITPQSALLEESDEIDDEDALDMPDLEPIEATPDAKPIASGDFFDLLDETSLKVALGESVDVVDNDTSDEEAVVEDVIENTETLEQLKTDIESEIAQSLNHVLNKNDMKEALKGLKININITFEEE